MAELNVCFFVGLPSSEPNAPWSQHQTPPTTSNATPTGPHNMLELIRQELQTELDTYGVTDPLEVEFSATVRRLMDSCTKDSIAVSTPEVKGCDVCTGFLSVSLQSGKSWILSHSHLPDECAKVAKFILRK